MNASARRNKPKARLNAYEALLAQDRNVKLDQVQIHIPAGPRLGGWSSRPTTCARPTATGC
jgi:sulfate-transporting ATPase